MANICAPPLFVTVLYHACSPGQGPDIRVLPPGPADPQAVFQDRVPGADLCDHLDNPAMVLSQEVTK